MIKEEENALEKNSRIVFWHLGKMLEATKRKIHSVNSRVKK
jgi:hypothetical protein